jgi:hypothetical protein
MSCIRQFTVKMVCVRGVFLAMRLGAPKVESYEL